MADIFENEIENQEMETLVGLADRLVYRLPGCSDVMVRKTIQEVYRDFCRRTCCLRVRRQFKAEPGRAAYSAAPAYGGSVDCISEVKYRGRTLRGGYDYSSRGPVVVLCDRLVPAEGTDEDSLPVVEISHVETPAISGEEVPSWFVERHGDSVCSGVLARLMRMSGKPWSDPIQAQAETMAYDSAVNEERVRFYGFGNGSMPDAVDCSVLI